MEIKVSVIMPSLNVGRYIMQSLSSVRSQTLKDIEIIAVDAGSSDGTLEILKRAAREDERVKIINSPVKSYGFQMNLGLKVAKGKYIGIVETDDFAEPGMLEALYNAAEAEELDVAKGSFWYYYTSGDKNEKYKFPKKFIDRNAFRPLSEREDMALGELFNIKNTIWSALYRREFLERTGITFNETPGASYQDTSFNFKVFAMAEKIRIFPEAFMHYRQDNGDSSVNSSGKVHCIRDEYAEIERFIGENSQLWEGEKTRLYGVMTRTRLDDYLWNRARLSGENRAEFVSAASKDLKEALAKGWARPEFFPAFKWEHLNMWAGDPEGFDALMDKDEGMNAARRAIRKINRMVKK